MASGIMYSGIPSEEELKNCPGIPSKERMKKGPVAFIECVECIPCNPCERACPAKAISIGSPITNMPVLDGDKCIGCGKCISKCPGLAITVINKAWSADKATLDFPYEYLPLPRTGAVVEAVDREGAVVCPATVISVSNNASDEGTCVIRIEFALEMADRVKSIKRIAAEV